MNGRPELSVVIPAFNEERNIRPMYEAVTAALGGYACEILFVDDGSRDGTAAEVRELSRRDPAVKLIRFGRNFGHQAALSAGLSEARGDAVITLDCDLQHPPELLPRMVSAWREGAAVVQMVRRKTDGAGVLKRLSASVFYWAINRLSETPVVGGAADYQLLDRAVVDAVLEFRDRMPFLRGLVAWLGFPSTRIEYDAPARRHGESGYSFGKMVRLSMLAVTALSAKPLRLSLWVGVISALFCLAYAAFALAALAQGATIPGWTSVIVTVLFLGAVQLLSLGILGEYVARVHDQTRGMPRYIVVERTGAARRAAGGSLK